MKKRNKIKTSVTLTKCDRDYLKEMASKSPKYAGKISRGIEMLVDDHRLTNENNSNDGLLFIQKNENYVERYVLGYDLFVNGVYVGDFWSSRDLQLSKIIIKLSNENIKRFDEIGKMINKNITKDEADLPVSFKEKYLITRTKRGKNEK